MYFSKAGKRDSLSVLSVQRIGDRAGNEKKGASWPLATPMVAPTSQALSALGNLCLCKQYCPWRLPSWLQRPPSRAGAPKVSLLLPRKPSPKAPGLKCTGQRLCLRDLPTVSNLGLVAVVVGNEAHIYSEWEQTQVGKKSISVAPAKYWNFRGPMLQRRVGILAQEGCAPLVLHG